MSGFCVDFLGVGPQRTGSSWLHGRLSGHPGLRFPRHVKETMFFDERYGRGVEWYAACFLPGHENTQTGEFGPTYFDTAEAIHRMSVEGKIQYLGAGHWHVAEVRRILGDSLIELKKYEEAEKELLESYSTFQKDKSLDSKHIKSNLKSLVKLYNRWGKKDKAQEYFELWDSTPKN